MQYERGVARCGGVDLAHDGQPVHRAELGGAGKQQAAVSRPDITGDAFDRPGHQFAYHVRAAGHGRAKHPQTTIFDTIDSYGDGSRTSSLGRNTA